MVIPVMSTDVSVRHQFNLWRSRMGERPVKIAMFDMSAAEIAEELTPEVYAIAHPVLRTPATPETMRHIEAELNEFLDYQVKIGRIKYPAEFLYRYEVGFVGHELNLTLARYNAQPTYSETEPPLGYIEWLKSELAKYTSL